MTESEKQHDEVLEEAALICDSGTQGTSPDYAKACHTMAQMIRAKKSGAVAKSSDVPQF